MKKTLAYEIRRNLLPLAIFSAVAVCIAAVYAFTAPLSNGAGRMRDSCIGVFAAILCVLCTVVPVMQFSYRMKQRSADLWYSLPVTRKKLMFVKILGGLVLVFVPYTLAYWLGVACVAMQEDGFVFVQYLSFWALSLPLGVGLFGACSFIFTRANTVGDGIVFLLLLSCVLPLAVMVLCSPLRFSLGWDPELPDYLNYYHSYDIAAFFFPHAPAGYFAGLFDTLACAQTPGEFAMFSLWFIIPVALLEGVGGYVGLFVCADRDRAENAGQVSDSWFGYRVLIPAYIVLLLGAAEVLFMDEIIVYVIMALIGAALYFAYRRSFRVKRADIICYLAAVAAGIVLAVVLHYCT